MIGEIQIINRFLAESENNPIKKDIGRHDYKHIISVINDEYWKEFVRKLEYCPSSSISVEKIGNWTIQYSPFKKYIRDLIKLLRNKQEFLKKLSENKEFDEEQSRTAMYVKDLRLKLSVAWKQLEEQRKIYILRYLLYTYKKQLKDPTFKPKYDYTWFPYSFKKELRNNSKVDLSSIDF